MTAAPDDEQATLREAVIRELNDLSEDALWTEKTHFAHAEGHARTALWLGLSSTISASAAAATVVSQAAPGISGILAVIAAITSGLLTFLKPRETEARHLSAARQLGALRVEIRQALRLDLAGAIEPDPRSWRELARKFATEKARIDQDSPATSERGSDAARKKIESGNFEHESDRAEA
jgi:hypothetical protein